MFTIQAIGVVRSPRKEATDDFWGGVRSQIVIGDDFDADALDGIEAFSHVEVLFVLHEVAPESIVRGTRHPRGNRNWPPVGIFAQRGRNRPNRLGSTIVRVLGRAGRTLEVEGLDAIDGTPVVDIKPVMTAFLPREPVSQPEWADHLMKDYFRKA